MNKSLNVQPFLKALAVIAVIEEKELKKATSDKLLSWGQASLPFLREVGISETLWKAVIKDTAANTDPAQNTMFAQRVKSLARLLTDKKSEIRKSPATDFDHADFIQDFCLYVKVDSAPAYTRLYQYVPALGDSCVNGLWAEDQDTPHMSVQKELNQKARLLLKRITKKNVGVSLIADAPNKNNKYYDQYKYLQRDLNRIYLARLNNMLTEKDAQYLPIEQVKSQLERENILHSLPEGFTGGNVGRDGKLFTSVGKPIGKTKLLSVVVNPDYDPILDQTYVFTGMNGSTVRRFYTEKEAAPVVHTKDISYMEDLPNLLSRLKRDFISEDNKAQALCLQLAYLMDENPVDVLQLDIDKIVPTTDGFTVRLPNKKTVKLTKAPNTRVKIKQVQADALFISHIKQLVSFRPEGAAFDTTSAKIRKYAKTLTNDKFKADDIIFYKDTLELRKRLATAPFDPAMKDYTEKAIRDFYGKQKKGLTAHPSVSIEYFKKYGAAIPKELR